MSFARVLFALFALFVATPVARASVFDEIDGRHGQMTVVSENDKYFAGTDRHYTNGFKLIWLEDTLLEQSPEFIRQVRKWVPTLRNNADNFEYKFGFALGQDIFTPTDTETAALIPNDRPYSAWLYASLMAHAQQVDGCQLRLLELAVGIVGPSALGQEFQNQWHDVINVPHAEGWANQLHDEPGVEISWERRYRVYPDCKVRDPRWFDLILRHRLTLGNVHTHLAGGFTARLGWNLPDDFGADLIRPGGGNAATTIDPAKRSFSTYVFASSEVRAVARNIFLDGNTWRSSHSVPKRPIVADLNLGLVFAWPQFQVTYTQNYRTKEFYGQPRRDVFGSIGFSWPY